MSLVESSIKEVAHGLIDQLPAKATWDDLQYLIYVRMAIESGVAAAENGRKIDDEEFCKRYGLRR